MKIAIISDIHSNLEALRKVFRHMQKSKISRIYCLGDIIGYGPFPRECLALIRKKCEKIVKGNHEDSLCLPDLGKNHLNEEAYLGLQFSRKKLHDGEIAFLSRLPSCEIIKEYGITLCHGAFTEPQISKYIMTEEEAILELSKIKTKICLIGHTHMPFIIGSKSGTLDLFDTDRLLNKDEKYLINVGSVGQPRNGDCCASYAVIEWRGNEIIFNLHRVFYKISKTEDAILNAGLPRYLAERLYRGE